MGAEGKRKPTDLFDALAHPLRRRILREMMRSEAEVTPTALACGLDEPLSVLSYHVRVLAECKAVKLVRTERVRGSTQHVYRCSLRTEWARTALEVTLDPPEKSRRRGDEKG
jgi:DNA-binding transcriptional ArsR family regulator